MRQIYKDIVIGMILASFTFSPTAFAKPQSHKVVKTTSKIPLYTELFKTVKANRKNLKVSQLVESAAPMVKKREMRDIKKLTLPFWDKKIQKFTIGKDYAKIKVKGESLFIRYVDRGPVAFIVNDKPVLWKDVLIYGRAKARMTEILTGKKRSKKVSFIESVLSEVFPKAYADDSKRLGCTNLNGTVLLHDDGTSYRGCRCPNGHETYHPNAPTCPTEVVVENPEPTTPIENPPVERTPAPAINKKLLIGIGLVVLLILLLKKKKKKGNDGGSSDPADPVPGWTPEPEGQCPTPGARGLTEADLPPECRASSCSDTNSCTGSSSGGAIDGY